MLQIAFVGCAGKYSYQLGIASHLSKILKDRENVHYSGSSSGCYPAMLMCLGIDFDEIQQTWNIPMLKDLNKYRCGALCYWADFVREWTLKILPEDAYKKCNGRLHLSLTRIDWTYPFIHSEIVSMWSSNEDMVDCMMASAWIPGSFFSKQCSLFTTYRGKTYCDGAIMNFAPILSKGKWIDGYKQKLPENCHVFVSNQWRKNCLSWSYPWSDYKWSETLYKWGKEDAEKNIYI